MNFNDFVNQYRIEEIKKAFENGEHKKSTLLGIAYDCGFNSKARWIQLINANTYLLFNICKYTSFGLKN